MKTYLLNHEQGYSRGKLRVRVKLEKLHKNPSYDAGSPVRFDLENKVIKKMNKMMADCYNKAPEKFCLKLLFDASFFWE